MKKIIFIILCVLTLGIGAAYSSQTPSGLTTPQSACQTVGNVTAEVGNGVVSFSNYNNYTVTVIWAVYGHTTSGSRHEVASGTKVLTAKADSQANFTKSSAYSSYSVKISVQKCD